MYRLFRVRVCRVYVLALCNQHDKICCLFSGCSCSVRIWKVHKKNCLFLIVLCFQAATWRKLFQQQKSFAKRVLERDLCCCCCCSCCFSSAASTLKSSIRPSPLLFALRAVHHTRSLSRTLSLSLALWLSHLLILNGGAAEHSWFVSACLQMCCLFEFVVVVVCVFRFLCDWKLKLEFFS